VKLSQSKVRSSRPASTPRPGARLWLRALVVAVTVASSAAPAWAQETSEDVVSPAPAVAPAAEAPAATSGEDAEDAASAELPRDVLGAGQTAETARLPFRGSRVSFSTVATAVSAQRDIELTYNPYLALNLDIAPRWWFGDTFYARGAFSLARELTEADENTYAGEFEPSDTTLGVGAYRLLTIPGAEIGISLAADVVLPSSKASRARTMNAAYVQALRLDRYFEFFSGLSLAYTVRVTEYDHDYTTGASQEPRISTCGGVGATCDPFLNTGVRNPQTQLTHLVSVSFAPIDSLEVAASGAYYTSYLHDVSESEDVSFDVADPTDTRWATGFGVSVGYTPAPPVTITLGTSTTNPVLASDGTYREPFFNRFTLVYLDLTLNVAGLVAAF